MHNSDPRSVLKRAVPILALGLLALGYWSRFESFATAPVWARGIIIFFFGLIPMWVIYDGMTRNVRNWTYWLVALFIPVFNIPAILAYALYGRKKRR